eukprot:TRINITY_DN13890_c0_g1_i4.p2 TRINITY_DN13890_c0_g1~~TRINITY_DN13890_c0_g1_i4.p2  ORF type:complete len:126 (+),score=44.40 TRINITY_DN13890_c0_g1_i4:71-448(+)
MLRSLVGSEMCIRDRYQRRVRGTLRWHQMSRLVGLVRSAFGTAKYKDGAMKAPHWADAIAKLEGAQISEAASVEWGRMLKAQTRRTELHDLEMERDGVKVQAGNDQQEMISKVARSVGLQVPERK